MNDEDTIRTVAESDPGLAELLRTHRKKNDFWGRLSRDMLTYDNAPGLSELETVVDREPEAALWVIAATRMVTYHCGSNPARHLRDVLQRLARRNADFVTWLKDKSQSPLVSQRRLAGDALAFIEAAPGWEKLLFAKP